LHVEARGGVPTEGGKVVWPVRVGSPAAGPPHRRPCRAAGHVDGGTGATARV